MITEIKLKFCFQKKKKEKEKKTGRHKKDKKIKWNTSFNKRFYILQHQKNKVAHLVVTVNY